MKASQKLEGILNYLEISANKFSIEIGLEQNTSIYHLKNDRNDISIEMAKLIRERYPEFSRNWLLTGEGDMLNNETSPNTMREKNNSPALIKENTYDVLLLPVEAIGGSLSDFAEGVKSYECERIISPIKGVDFAVTVSGESMFPEYPSGSRVLVKKIDEKAFIDWGRVFVLDTCNGTVIKKLMPVDGDNSRVKCVSINEEYPPFEIALGDVYGIYRVLMMLSMK